MENVAADETTTVRLDVIQETTGVKLNVLIED